MVVRTGHLNCFYRATEKSHLAEVLSVSLCLCCEMAISLPCLDEELGHNLWLGDCGQVENLFAAGCGFFQHETQHLLRHGRVPYRSKRLPVQRRRTMLAQRRQ